MTSTADRGATTLENDDSSTTDLREAKAALHPPPPQRESPNAYKYDDHSRSTSPVAAIYH